MTRRRKVAAVDPMAVVTRFIDAANHHDVDALRACVHREFESVQPIHPGRNFRGPGQLISNWRAIFEAEPGFRLSVRRASVTDNTVWVEVHGAGASAEAAGIFIVGIEDGRIRWIRVYSDLVEPAPEPPEPAPESQPQAAVDDDEGEAIASEGDGHRSDEDDEPRIRLVGDADQGTDADPVTDAAADTGEEAGAAEGLAEPAPALTLVQPSTEAEDGSAVDDEGDPGVDDATDEETSIGAERPDEILPVSPIPDTTGTPDGTDGTDGTDVTDVPDVPADEASPGDETPVAAPEAPVEAPAEDAWTTATPEVPVLALSPTEPAPRTKRNQHSWRRWPRGRGD